jgi:hypothetical protein
MADRLIGGPSAKLVLTVDLIVPDFFSNGVGWVGIGGDFIAVSGARPPVTYDPAHPYVPNGTSAAGSEPRLRGGARVPEMRQRRALISRRVTASCFNCTSSHC